MPLRLVSTREELERLHPGWRRLDEGSGWTMGHSAWLLALLDTVHATDELQVVVAGELPRPSGVAALVRSRRTGSALSLPGREFDEPTDFSYADTETLAALARGVARLARPLCLGRLPAGSPTVGALRAAYRGRGLVITRPAVPAPTIALGDCSADPATLLSSKRRSDLRRARRRAEQIGTVTTEFLAPGSHDLPAVFAEAVRVEGASWKTRAGSAIASGGAESLVFRRFASRAAGDGSLRVCLLRIGGQAAAMQLAIEKAGHFCLLKIGYDERFGRASPGQLLLLESLRAAARRGIRHFELLGRVEEWTRMWTGTERPCVSLRAYPVVTRTAPVAISDAAGLVRARAVRLRRTA
jgi:CelD/BcsL family acetyltransferase involved in cellulose biosynthesis